VSCAEIMLVIVVGLGTPFGLGANVALLAVHFLQ
jgi:hypothetical protein